jgi:SAM-dependent methyltransferase
MFAPDCFAGVVRRILRAHYRIVTGRIAAHWRCYVVPPQVSGTEGYAKEAEELLKRYEAVPAFKVHRAVLHLIPHAPADVLDIGSGTGRDAAWFASMGHRVVAAEPTEAMRMGAMRLHTSPRIEWLDDSLPDLALLRHRGVTFDLVMLSAVWMHLDLVQRQRAMSNLAALVAIGGTVIMTLRHGPVPVGRRMFEVSPDETIGLASAHGLHLTLTQYDQSSLQQNRATAVGWTTLAFTKARPA